MRTSSTLAPLFFCSSMALAMQFSASAASLPASISTVPKVSQTM